MNKLIFLFSIFFIFSLPSFGIVDIQSAGYSKTFIDFKHQGRGYLFQIERTYNSRSLFNGIFGFAWCSNFETELNVLPDNSVKVVECGGGLETFYYPKNKGANVPLQIDLIVKAMKKQRVKMSDKSLAKLKKDLIQSQTLRADFLKALNIKGQASQGTVYYANGKFNETVVLTKQGYKRVLPNGVKEFFNNKGQLVKILDQKGGSAEIQWSPKTISMTDHLGQRLVLHLDSQTKKVKFATFQNKKIATYKYKNENLVQINNFYKEQFAHNYDKLHNLTQTTYPDKTTEAITYNVNKDWVMSFKDRKNCLETYFYGKNPKNPNHYFSTVQKKCGRKIVNKSKYEFWNRSLGPQKKYLYRARARVNGRLKTDVIYHPKFGAPVSLLKNGVRTTRTYYDNGFLKTKSDPYKKVVYKNYNKQCRKPELVHIAYKDKNKIAKKEIIKFSFTSNCQLSVARKSRDEWIRVKHDNQGRLYYMEDQSRKVITLKWHKTLNKPEIITRSGVGSVKIVYDQTGRVVNLKAGENSGPTIISQVSSVFNSFLKTLSPVAEEMAVL